jgi:hypothetical protein
MSLTYPLIFENEVILIVNSNKEYPRAFVQIYFSDDFLLGKLLG